MYCTSHAKKENLKPMYFTWKPEVFCKVILTLSKTVATFVYDK